jgi:dihydropteroate synthase
MNCRLNVSGRLFDLSTPAVMGILNLTPDSFHAASRVTGEDAILQLAARHVQEGASLLDLGAQSTRPGAELLDAETEWSRLAPALRFIRTTFPEVILSVDTFYATVAEKSLAEGADMINDVSGGRLDHAMFPLIVRSKVPYVLMHMQGTPRTMQGAPYYENVTAEVVRELAEGVDRLRQAGVPDVLVDPGFGFGKDLDHNYTLLRQLEAFRVLDAPLLVGLSRKSMVNKVLGTTAGQALNGTTVLHTLALLGGASILRVHDVREAAETVRLVARYRQDPGGSPGPG